MQERPDFIKILKAIIRNDVSFLEPHKPMVVEVKETVSERKGGGGGGR